MSTDPHQDSLASELQVSLRVDLDHRINYAMQQNDVPIVKALTKIAPAALIVTLTPPSRRRSIGR